MRDLPSMQRLTHPERRALVRTYAWRSFRRPITWLGVLAVPGLAVAVEMLLLRWLPRLVGPHATLHGTLPVLLCELAGFRLWLQGQLTWMNRQILRDHPQLCRACGFDMRVTPHRCCECGAVPSHAVPHLAVDDRPPVRSAA